MGDDPPVIYHLASFRTVRHSTFGLRPAAASGTDVTNNVCNRPGLQKVVSDDETAATYHLPPQTSCCAELGVAFFKLPAVSSVPRGRQHPRGVLVHVAREEAFLLEQVEEHGFGRCREG